MEKLHAKQEPYPAQISMTKNHVMELKLVQLLFVITLMELVQQTMYHHVQQEKLKNYVILVVLGLIMHVQLKNVQIFQKINVFQF